MKVALGKKLTYDLAVFKENFVSEAGQEMLDNLVKRLLNQGYHEGLSEQWDDEENARAMHDRKPPS